jgi:hypothetical protein
MRERRRRFLPARFPNPLLPIVIGLKGGGGGGEREKEEKSNRNSGGDQLK